jgi:hypothetical protein
MILVVFFEQQLLLPFCYSATVLHAVLRRAYVTIKDFTKRCDEHVDADVLGENAGAAVPGRVPTEDAKHTNMGTDKLLILL